MSNAILLFKVLPKLKSKFSAHNHAGNPCEVAGKRPRSSFAVGARMYQYVPATLSVNYLLGRSLSNAPILYLRATERCKR